MKKSQIRSYKQQLLVLRARLRGDANHMFDAALIAARSDDNGEISPVPMQDAATEHFGTELAVSVLETQAKTLNRIEEALERMEAGVYGTYSGCGRGIPKARLRAIPYAIRCVQCATQLETH